MNVTPCACRYVLTRTNQSYHNYDNNYGQMVFVKSVTQDALIVPSLFMMGSSYNVLLLFFFSKLYNFI